MYKFELLPPHIYIYDFSYFLAFEIIKKKKLWNLALKFLLLQWHAYMHAPKAMAALMGTYNQGLGKAVGKLPRPW